MWQHGTLLCEEQNASYITTRWCLWQFKDYCALKKKSMQKQKYASNSFDKKMCNIDIPSYIFFYIHQFIML